MRFLLLSILFLVIICPIKAKAIFGGPYAQKTSETNFDGKKSSQEMLKSLKNINNYNTLFDDYSLGTTPYEEGKERTKS
jgi:hypothetical protein